MKAQSTPHPQSAFVTYLHEHYLQKKAKNPYYSISAFARDLGISQSFMSRMLNRERPPTVKVAMQVAAVLGVSGKVTDTWISSIILDSPKGAKISKKVREVYERNVARKPTKSILDYEVDRFKVMSQWYHLAILYLTYTKTFKGESQWIARRIGISVLEAKAALSRLVELGMLEETAKGFRCVHQLLVVDSKKSEIATREFHKQMTQKALEVVSDPSPEKFEERLFSSVTFAIDKKRVPEFKAKIKAFQKEILEMLESETYTEVYHLNLQLFPITQEKKS